MCHIPFIFFGGKEALLITIDELMRKSISNALWHKMQAAKSASFGQEIEHRAPNPDLPIPGSDSAEPYGKIEERLVESSDIHQGLMESREHSAAVMSHVSASAATRIAYKDMNYCLYICATLSFYILIVTVSLCLEIGPIIDIVSGYCSSCLAYFIPAIYYRKAVNMYSVD